MEKINGMVCWYQQKIGTYDKQLWERSVEKTVIKNIELMPRKLTKVKTDLIDVDLVRGSTFPKAKPKHGWWLVSWRGLLRVVFLPLYIKWWRQQSSIWFSLILLFLYISQVGTLVVYTYDSGAHVSAETLSLAHLVSPVLLVLIVGFIHSQIVATQSLHKHRRPITPDRHTGVEKKKKKTSKVSRSKPPVMVDDYTSGHADTEETEITKKRKRKSKVIRKKSSSNVNEEYTGLKTDRPGLLLKEIDRSTSVDSSNVCTEEEDLNKLRRDDIRLLRKFNKDVINANCDINDSDILNHGVVDATLQQYEQRLVPEKHHAHDLATGTAAILCDHVTESVARACDHVTGSDARACDHVTGSDDRASDHVTGSGRTCYHCTDGLCSLTDSVTSEKEMLLKGGNIRSDRVKTIAGNLSKFCYKNSTTTEDGMGVECPSGEDLSLPLASFDGEILSPSENGFQLTNDLYVPFDGQNGTEICAKSRDNPPIYDVTQRVLTRLSSSEKSALNGTSEEGMSDFENITVTGILEGQRGINGSNNSINDSSNQCRIKPETKGGISQNNEMLLDSIGDLVEEDLKKSNSFSVLDQQSREVLGERSTADTFIVGEGLGYDTIGATVKGIPSPACVAEQYFGPGGVDVVDRMSVTETARMERVVGTIESLPDPGDCLQKLKERTQVPPEIQHIYPPADATGSQKVEGDKDETFLKESKMKIEDLLGECRKEGRTMFSNVQSPGIRGLKHSSENSSCESDGETTPNVPTPKAQTSEMEWDANSGDMTTDTSSQVTTETELSGREEDGRDSDGYGWSENVHHANSVMNNLASSNDKVSCIIWEGEEVKKVDLTVLDLGWTIIQKADKIPEKSDYLALGVIFSLVIMCLPVLFRFHQLRDRLESPQTVGNLTGYLQIIRILIGDNWVEQVVIVNGLLQRLCCALIFFFLLSVAERTFKQRLLYAKHFCYLTSCRRAKKYDMPHFRLNKVRNIKTWLSLRSYLKRRGPQRSVNTIVSSAFILEVTVLSLMCVQLLHDSGGFLDHLGNWEVVTWCLALGIYLLRFMTLGTQINKKYRNFSVLITEQINLYLHMEQKPHKKEELTLANNVLKLAEALLKELENPFKISGLSVNPFLYNTFKVVILSAFSAVLTELLGFKLKLYKIKLKG